MLTFFPIINKEQLEKKNLRSESTSKKCLSLRCPNLLRSGFFE